MKKLNKKIITLLLASLISSGTSGCSNEISAELAKPNEFITSTEYEINVLSPKELEDLSSSSTVTKEKEQREEKEETYQIEMVDTIVATEDAKILDVEGNLLGTLPEGREIKVNTSTEDGSYEVTYYGDTAYIDANFVIESETAEVVGKMQKVLYATKDTVLIVPGYLNPDGEELEVKIDALECFEVYDEFEDSYLVQTIDYVGYIAKDNLEELTGTFVVVDISSQELRLYKDNEVLLICPVITGTPTEENHTDEGLWEIYDISYNRKLIGPGYASPVDIMLKFNGGEGLHDAEYHSCEYWQKNGKDPHGWRYIYQFGGNTYLTNGSHGCVNMRNAHVFFVADYVELGTKVLVKK